MLQKIPSIIPKIFLPIVVLIICFLILAAAMYLSRIISEYMSKRKNPKSEAALELISGNRDDQAKSDEVNI